MRKYDMDCGLRKGEPMKIRKMAELYTLYLQRELASAFGRVNCLELAIEHMTGKLVNES